MMKKFKHIPSLVLAVLLLLAACGRNLADSTDPSEPEATKATGSTSGWDPEWDRATRPATTYPDQYTEEIEISVQYLPSVVDNPDNLPVLKWLCLMQDNDKISYGRVWSEAAAVEVNQMLADRNMPFRVQFALYMSDYTGTHMPFDWLVRPEIQEDLKTADLILHNFPMDQVEEYLEPLTRYINGGAEPSLKNAVPHKNNWLITTKDGEIYGISYYNDMPKSVGWVVDSEFFGDSGLTEQDFQKEFWEMDDLLAAIYEKNGNKAFLYVPSDGVLGTVNYASGRADWTRYPRAVGLWMETYYINAGSAFAVDFSQEKPTVVNVLDTEISRKIQAALKRYSEAGYLIREVREGKWLLEMDMLWGHRAYTDWGGEVAIPVTEPIYEGNFSNMWRSNSVLAASEHKHEAITLLNLIAEDEEFRTRLLYGKEGRDYTVDADGNYERVKQEDDSIYTMKFLSPLGQFTGRFSGMRGDIGFMEIYTVYEGKTKLESYREIWDNAGDPYYSVPFDFTGLEKEVEEVYFRARYYFGKFTKLSEEEYNTMIADMNAAGGDKIMAELQKQLDEWVKANPDKVAANRQ